MEAKDFRAVILFMANKWNRETAHKIFGTVMGDHFYGKWYDSDNPDLGTMRLFYDMDDKYLQSLLDYIKQNEH